MFLSTAGLFSLSIPLPYAPYSVDSTARSRPRDRSRFRGNRSSRAAVKVFYNKGGVSTRAVVERGGSNGDRGGKMVDIEKERG